MKTDEKKRLGLPVLAAAMLLCGCVGGAAPDNPARRVYQPDGTQRISRTENSMFPAAE